MFVLINFLLQTYKLACSPAKCAAYSFPSELGTIHCSRQMSLWSCVFWFGPKKTNADPPPAGSEPHECTTPSSKLSSIKFSSPTIFARHRFASRMISACGSAARISASFMRFKNQSSFTIPKREDFHRPAGRHRRP